MLDMNLLGETFDEIFNSLIFDTVQVGWVLKFSDQEFDGIWVYSSVNDVEFWKVMTSQV
jgi:hypothetical protein